MAGTINTPTETKKAHQSYIDWLNGLLNDYVSSFYDEAVKNIIKLSFIKEHNSFIQELYQADGRVLSGFLSVMPTDTTNFLMMVHNIGSGKPFLYNKENGADLFEFDSLGRLIRFYENVTVDLYNSDGTVVAECYTAFEDWFGVKCPMFYIKEKGTNALIGKGFIDIIYSDKYSGCYMVRNKPLDEYPHFKITNVTKAQITMDVPILTDLSVRYTIPANTSVEIPITEWSDYFFRQGKELEGLTIKRI